MLEGGTPGYLHLLSPTPPSSSPSRTVPAAVSSPEADREGRRSERGSQAGLTLWPPTAGAEAATRPASLRKGKEGNVATNTRGKLGLYILLSNVFFLSPYFSPYLPLPDSPTPYWWTSFVLISAAPFFSIFFFFLSDWAHTLHWLGLPGRHVSTLALGHSKLLTLMFRAYRKLSSTGNLASKTTAVGAVSVGNNQAQINIKPINFFSIFETFFFSLWLSV